MSALIQSLEKISALEVEWEIQESLPLVRADRMVWFTFLNLAKNGQRAMQTSETKRLCISVLREGSTVVIRFEDTGVGISSPENLFRPFQRGADSSGLGLYVSRAIIHSFGGELLYEHRSRGCCFAVVLSSLSPGKEVVNA